MFGKRGEGSTTQPPVQPAVPESEPQQAASAPAAAQAQAIPGLDLGGASAAQPAEAAPEAAAPAKPAPPKPARESKSGRSENYYDIKTTIFNALIDAIDLTQLGQLERDAARDEIRDIVNEIISIKRRSRCPSPSRKNCSCRTSATTFLATDRLSRYWRATTSADIMVNGARPCASSKLTARLLKTGVRFARQCVQLMNICQRIVSQVGRRVDEASPICDARLPDGSRVNVIAPPLVDRWRRTHHS